MEDTVAPGVVAPSSNVVPYGERGSGTIGPRHSHQRPDDDVLPYSKSRSTWSSTSRTQG